ncbi:MAG: LytR/AlgR family response regulator transcription factor [Deltaproteobacteria bacterium]
MIARVFIVEDELIHSEALKIVLEELGLELAGECSNADDAFEMIKQSKPDVLLVDISLPGIMNGMMLAKKIHDELGIPHIFTTSFNREEIIDQAVATKPSGYITKPVESAELIAAIKIALQNKTQGQKNIDHHNKDFIFTKIGNNLVRINYNEIIIIKSDGDNFISLITEKKVYPCRITLKEFHAQLPPNFIQTHRSYVINIDHLDYFNEPDQTAILKGHDAPVARGYKKDFLDSIKRI